MMRADMARPAPYALIFAAALVIRWAYALALYATMGDGGIEGVDSLSYVAFARAFAEAVAAGQLHGWDWLGPHPVVMPLFNGLVALAMFLFDGHGPLAYVLGQGALDAGTCVLIARIAGTIDMRYAAPAGWLAAINPTQIVVAGLLYPDTPFVFFIALSFLGCARWLRAATWRDAILIAFGLAGAALCRVLIVPWAAALIVVLALVALRRGRFDRAALGQLAAIALVIAIGVGAIVARNVARYGTFALTSQGGMHLALWIVPLVKEAQDATPWAATYDAMEARTRARFGPPDPNPFEEARRYTEIGSGGLRELKSSAIAKAWVFGAAINMGAPAVTLSPPILQIPRTGFYATPGASLAGKVRNFLFHSTSAIYTWSLFLGIAGLAAMRIVQLVGAVAIIRGVRTQDGTAPLVALFALWFVFVLAVNGPVASPKYRLPLEPVLMVLGGAGLAALVRRRAAA